MLQKQVKTILQALDASARFWGATIVECTGHGGTVNMTVCCIGHADKITKSLRVVHMVVTQDGCTFTVRYPTESERRKMQ